MGASDMTATTNASDRRDLMKEVCCVQEERPRGMDPKERYLFNYGGTAQSISLCGRKSLKGRLGVKSTQMSRNNPVDRDVFNMQYRDA
ncbi:hypothetical protein AVEN_160123-1 [Araneus ventricosus]|uniref:Uncharacterized protein n=1 Tax=Araneus ventricosus TaxID=182803 RepID=A0A4Y2KEC9_ARAVE|nr:hypothetical protein AVEN_160123-1 [Araneus ventricosus]